MKGKEKKRVQRKEPREPRAKKIAGHVEFSYRDPGAARVFVAGDFNDWNTESHPLKKDPEGIWKTKMKLPPGRYEYKFCADGAWVEEVPGIESVTNRFCTKNFIISVE